MNESVGYTVTINIVIVFIVIAFVFISNVLIYYKSNKVGNVIVESIEKYSGFNTLAKNDIEKKLDSIGYNKTNITCIAKVPGNENGTECGLVSEIGGESINTGEKGYCVYSCNVSNNYYYYKVKANMMINIPIINDIVNGTVFSSTINMYNFEGVTRPAPLKPTIAIGDVNGDGSIDVKDWCELRKNNADISVSEYSELIVSDINEDGVINAMDATRLAQILDIDGNTEKCN